MIILHRTTFISLPPITISLCFLQIPLPYLWILVLLFCPPGFNNLGCLCGSEVGAIHLRTPLAFRVHHYYYLLHLGLTVMFVDIYYWKMLGYRMVHFYRTWSSFYILLSIQLFLAKMHGSQSLPWSLSRCYMNHYSPFITLIFICSSLW